LSVLVGGAVFASAADKPIIASTSDIEVTNVAPLVWTDVVEIPKSAFLNNSNVTYFPGFVTTDAKGKIIGVANIIKNWTIPDGTNAPKTVAQSSWVTDVKGTVKASKMGQPTIQMNLKGNGYSAPNTNLLVINGETAVAGASTLSLNFKSTAIPVPVRTNGVVVYGVVGNYKGSAKTGITAINNNKPIKIDEAAAMEVDRNSVQDLSMRVVRYGSKLNVIAGGGDGGLWGSGNVNSKNQFTVNLKDGGLGSSLQLKGQLAALVWVTEGATNTVSSISTMSQKGKIDGQAVEGNGIFSRFLTD